MGLETRLVSPRRVGPPFAVGVLAVLGTIPFAAAIELPAAVPQWFAVVAIIAGGVGVVGVATVVGAALASDVGLRTLAVGRLPGDGINAYRLPVAAGVSVALVTAGFYWVVTALGQEPALLNQWADGGSLVVLVNVAGSVITELVLRFGLMTLVVWVVWTRRPALDRGVTRSGWWSGVLTAALVGGAVTVAVAVGSGVEPVPALLTGVGPLVGGVVFGLLYWRYDLAAAVVAHATASLLRTVVAILL